MGALPGSDFFVGALFTLGLASVALARARIEVVERLGLTTGAASFLHFLFLARWGEICRTMVIAPRHSTPGITQERI